MKLLLSCSLAVAVGVAAFIPVLVRSADRPENPTIHFNRDIRPILSNHCFKCHGPDQKKGGLDLQTRDGATAKLKSGDVAIIPGKSAMSHLIARVIEADDSQRMPPKGKGERLTATQIATLKRWIDEGATYEPHWAYRTPERPALPKVKNVGWVRNPIDAFILARLEQEGLTPAPEAERAVLVRRLSLDLTGLPPTIAELDRVLSDASPRWYEDYVDRLLASPHYGERQARPWLDLARYADTNGYEKDDRRIIWPYRDWVIAAFNRDLSFDQFTIEQLAGDLLPPVAHAPGSPLLDPRIATGFHRNTMVNTEGGVDAEEFRVAAVVDRVNTTMAVWMGSTFGCAQCHNHKYDPFSQKEYYQLYAFFNSTTDHGSSNEPTMPVPSAEETARRELIQAEIAKVQATLDLPTPELEAAQVKWEKTAQGQAAMWTPLTVTAMTSASGATLTKQADGSILVGGTNPAVDIYKIELSTELKGITAIRLEVLPDASLPAMGPGRAPNGNFVLNELRLKESPKGQAEKAAPVALQKASADYSQEDWPVAGAIDGDARTGWAISPQFGKAHLAVFETRQDIGHDGGTLLFFTLEQSFGSQHTIGKFRLSATTAPRPVSAGGLPEPIVKLLRITAEQRTLAQKEELARYYRSIAAELAKARQQIDVLKKQEAAIKSTTTMVLKELPQPRATHVMIRGNHKNFGDKVTPGVPAVLHPLAGGPQWSGLGLSRLDLAKWLTDPKNPLVGRVTMNRLWAQHFGRGLVETGEDFGVQGDLPTHPELLDWLAMEFMASGNNAPAWSMKKMHKLIVTSATYRQSSRVTKDLLDRDPYNRLYARGPRFRIESEMVRDNALAISGLLNRKIGGPSVFPFQPDGVWANPYSGDRWVQSTGGEQHRRGLYTFWRRTAPYATFMSFDAPSREVCTERRPRSNTPLQALATLNDHAFVECAQSLARRIVSEAKGGEKDRLIHGFRLCVSRPPSDRELDTLLKLYRESLAKYQKDAAAAKAMASSASLPAPKDADLAELAAWTVIANVLLNLDETITQG